MGRPEHVDCRVKHRSFPLAIRVIPWGSSTRRFTSSSHIEAANRAHFVHIKGVTSGYITIHMIVAYISNPITNTPVIRPTTSLAA